MSDSLEDFLQRLRRQQNPSLDNEEATRQGIILPVLARLGWDRDNVREVFLCWFSVKWREGALR